jgi:hypothetical protein
MYRFTASDVPAGFAGNAVRAGTRPTNHLRDSTGLSETLWQLQAGEHAVLLTCCADTLGVARVVNAPALLHYMKGWLVDDVARYARKWGWRLALVA